MVSVSHVFAAAVVLLGSTATAHANLVRNGDFSGPSGGGTYVTYNSGSSIGAWMVTGGSVDLIGGYWQSPHGVGPSVDLDGNSPGGLSQTIPTLAGHIYKLSFYLSGNPDGPSLTKHLSVSAGSLSTSVSYTIGSNTLSDMQYVLESFTFTAAGPTILAFTSLDTSTPYGPVIGRVSVTDVPEPASMALFGSGLLGLGLVAKRRKSG